MMGLIPTQVKFRDNPYAKEEDFIILSGFDFQDVGFTIEFYSRVSLMGREDLRMRGEETNLKGLYSIKVISIESIDLAKI